MGKFKTIHNHYLFIIFYLQKDKIVMQTFVISITLFLGYLCLSKLSVTQYVTIHGGCNFGKPFYLHQNEMRAYVMIPESSTLLNIMSCNVWYNSSRSILRLWLQKTSNQTKTTLVSTVVDEQGTLVFPGYITQAEEQVAYLFHICPSLAESSSRNYSIFLSAPPLTGRFIKLIVFVEDNKLLVTNSSV